MTKKKKGVTGRIIYNKDYYKAQAMLRDPWFIEKVAWLKKRFKEVDCPLPPKGYKKYKQYLEWRDKYWKKHGEMVRSQDFISKRREITGGKDRFSIEELNKLEAFEESYLPPVYGEIINEILEHYRIPKSEDKFYDFVEWFIFLNRKDFLSSIMQINMTRDEKTGEKKMFVQIFEYTKKEDILKNWDFILDMQKYLPGYIGKSKKWERFDRDLEIYSLYKKIKKEKNEDPKWNPTIDRTILGILGRTYPELTLSRIRDIVCKTAEKLGEITI